VFECKDKVLGSYILIQGRPSESIIYLSRVLCLSVCVVKFGAVMGGGRAAPRLGWQ
jgi:hypothetical protein